MARGPVITDAVREKIASVYLANEDLVAKEVQQQVNSLCNGHGPGLSAIQKQLTILRRPHDENWKEEIWSLWSYKHFEIPPEALPTILQLWLLSRKEDRVSLTNREVMWAVRLHTIYKDVRALKERAKSIAFSDLLGDINHLMMMGHPRRVIDLVEDLNGKQFSEEERAEIQHVPSPNHTKEALDHIEKLRQHQDSPEVVRLSKKVKKLLEREETQNER